MPTSLIGGERQCGYRWQCHGNISAGIFEWWKYKNGHNVSHLEENYKGSDEVRRLILTEPILRVWGLESVPVSIIVFSSLYITSDEKKERLLPSINNDGERRGKLRLAQQFNYVILAIR